MDGKEVDIMQGTMITEKVVEPGRRTVGEEETTISTTEADTEDVVEETTEEVEEAVIMEVVEAMQEGKVEAVEVAAITVKSTEADEETVPMLREVTVAQTTAPVT